MPHIFHSGSFAMVSALNISAINTLLTTFLVHTFQNDTCALMVSALHISAINTLLMTFLVCYARHLDRCQCTLFQTCTQHSLMCPMTFFIIACNNIKSTLRVSSPGTRCQPFPACSFRTEAHCDAEQYMVGASTVLSHDMTIGTTST